MLNLYRSEKIGRNEKCLCGNMKKYKKCCGINHTNFRKYIP